MNSVVLTGRLTKDPDLRYLQNGTPLSRFTLAVDKDLSKDKKEEFAMQNKPTADFINITVWNKTAEAVANYTEKGKKIAVQGRIQTRSWQAEDGTRRYATEVVAEKVEFLEWKDGNSSNNNYNYDDVPDGFHPIDNDDIPF